MSECPDELMEFSYTITIQSGQCKYHAEDDLCWHPKFCMLKRTELKEEYDCCKNICPFLQKGDVST